MFYLKTGTYLHFVILNSEVHLVATSPYPAEGSGDMKSCGDALNEGFLHWPNWEAVGVRAMLEFREDKNTARFYVPSEVFFVFKKKMRSIAWNMARETYPATSFEYNEMPEGNFPELAKTQTFSRTASGDWAPEEVPVGRALYASTSRSRSMRFSDEILKLADMLPEACGDGACTCGGTCNCGGDSDCGCGAKRASWFDDDVTASDWHEESSDWYEDEIRDAGSNDDDDIVEALRKRTQKSKFQKYKKRRDYYKKNPSKRRRKNLQQRKRRRKGPYKQKQKRYRRLTKRSPRSKRRSPRKY